jgi:predicted 3-demethylubiquinone-9 3-methyltransferase (glyoxalase superfamily)
MQKITPFLWFNDQAEEAVKFYKSIFKRAKVLKIARYGEGGSRASGQKKGSVMTIEFELERQRFIALNGGPHFKFTEAISFVVNCKTQGGDRLLLEETLGGRARKSMLLAQGQVWGLLANFSRYPC